MSVKKPQKMSAIELVLMIAISLWLTYEFLKYDIQCFWRKYKINEIINSIYNKGVDLCRRLIETKSES